jgi:HSP20 family protein
MSSALFPRFNEFSPFLRFAEELDRATRLPNGTNLGNSRSFAPRFDVKETKDAYELHGELPGIEQSNINIEWTDEDALVVSGHTEKVYESGNETRVRDGLNDKKATVKEDAEGAAPADTTVAKTADNKEITKSPEYQPRYWITERSYGSFSRTFNFPSNVDHDRVKANLKNGILEIVVPKAKAKEPRKIQIN